MRNLFQELVEDESGVTSVEYALLAGAAAAVIGVTGAAFYEQLQAAFGRINLTLPD